LIDNSCLTPYSKLKHNKKEKLKMNKKLSKLKLVVAAATLVCANFAFLSAVSSAATLSNTYIRLARMKSGTDSTMRVVFKTTANAGATGLTIDMNGADSTTWTSASGTVNTTQAISGVAGCDVSATALPGGSLAASGSGSVITVTNVTALSASTTYCFDLTTSSSVHTPSAGEYHPVITETGGATDSTTVAVRVVSDDQVLVNATVPPSFNFALSCPQSAPNRDNFGSNLATGSVSNTTGCDVTVNTNATTGWLAWAQDLNTGLHSVTASKTIAATTPGSNATLSAGTEGFLMGVTSITQGSGSGGTTSATNAYGNGSGGTAGAGQGSGLDGTLRLFASSTGTASGAVVHVKESAAISAVTPAANDYTDTITLVGAGNF
jgi:hypothetical protein